MSCGCPSRDSCARPLRRLLLPSRPGAGRSLQGLPRECPQRGRAEGKTFPRKTADPGPERGELLPPVPMPLNTRSGRKPCEDLSTQSPAGRAPSGEPRSPGRDSKLRRGLRGQGQGAALSLLHQPPRTGSHRTGQYLGTRTAALTPGHGHVHGAAPLTRHSSLGWPGPRQGHSRVG